MPTTALTTAGIALIAVAVRDVLLELFHPELKGSMSRIVAQVTWRGLRAVSRVHRAFVHHAGPVMLVAIGATWLSLIAVGAALVYAPRLPHGFDVSRTLPPAAQQGFGTALYVSFAIMTSVGSGDISPESPAVRAMAAIQPVLGLVLISAWITWVLSIYPIIARRRAFAREIDLLRRAERQPAAFLNSTPRDAVAELLRSFTSRIVRVTSDLAQAHITYYFQNEQQHLALDAQLPYVLALARAAEARTTDPVVAHYGARLRFAIEDLLAEVATHHLGVPGAPPEQVIDALARDHLLDKRLLQPDRSAST